MSPSVDDPVLRSSMLDEKRRDFLIVTANAFATVGLAAGLWPFIDSMNPSADVSAISSVRIDLIASPGFTADNAETIASRPVEFSPIAIA